jgi:hypothetical protein
VLIEESLVPLGRGAAKVGSRRRAWANGAPRPVPRALTSTPRQRGRGQDADGAVGEPESQLAALPSLLVGSAVHQELQEPDHSAAATRAIHDQ